MLHSPPLPPHTFQMMLPWAGEMSPFLTKTEGLGHALQLGRRGVRWETERNCDSSFMHFCKEQGLHFKRKLPSRGGSQGGPHSHPLSQGVREDLIPTPPSQPLLSGTPSAPLAHWLKGSASACASTWHLAGRGSIPC